ncbi:MAG: hypothetical protein KAR19_01870 [Bacteroidales bacterium]|nr:hypothetical protein [Bacteroidales bacterium]
MNRTSTRFQFVARIFKFGFVAIIISLSSCKPVEQELKVKVETGSITEVGYTFCIIQGKVVDIGDGKIEQHGFCFNTSENPTIINDNTQLGSRTAAGSFSDSILNLQSGTTYYIRAYAIASDENYYGDQISVTMLTPTSPVVAIESVGEYENDTLEISIIVTDDGGEQVTARGVCWSLEQNPTTDHDCTTDGSGTGSFTSYITGLAPDTAFYIRAYATSSAATSYSDQHQVSTPPGSVSIATEAITGITMNSAVSGGNITNDGGSEIAARGVCWSTSQNPTISDSKTMDGTGIGSFTSSISGLSPGTTYYVRAYATNSSETFYGDELNFSTTSQSASLPVLTTTAASGITENSAVSGGTITDDGGSSVIARGVCWSTSHNPDLSHGFTVDGTGTGIFTSSITGLSPNTTYYVRAYATNSEGTSYGSEEGFTTDQAHYLPTLTTTSVSSITESSAVSGGNITDDGGSAITARGVCWSTSHNPDLTDSNTTDGTGTGTYTSSITGLTANTTYYVRAYATNGEGTSYGNEESFTTDQSLFLPTLTTASATSITENSAVSGGNVTDDGGSSVIARGVCWSTSPGPDLVGDHTTDGSGTGSYTSSVTGLSPNSLYYMRAYATNGQGTAYGNEVSFTTSTSPSLPTLTTTSANSIATNSAKSGGNITDDGGSLVVARGVCWSTSPNPDLTGNYTTDGGGNGSFTSILIGLDASTTYYVRAYATNGTGTAYGDEISFTTMDMGESVTDIDGNVYQTLVIGTQTWMAENLKVTHYANGDQIPQLTGILDWTATSEGAYCYYSNDISTYGTVYGALYNWIAVDDNRNICPDNWHVPGDAEWNVLIEFAGGSDIAGAKLKEVGNEHWNGNEGSTNEFGFTALPGGERDEDGGFSDIRVYGKWWTSDIADVFPTQRWNYSIFYSGYKITKLRWYPNAGYSIRCIKD